MGGSGSPVGTPSAHGDATGEGRQPLEGLHVLDLSRVLAGPFLTMVLGDLGADVIKVEQPGVGDDTRQWGPPFVGAEDAKESTYFLSVNRNKRSVEIDLKSDADRPLVEDLVRWADLLVENFRPGVLERLGLSDERLTDLNPRLVRLSISGFGDEGPERDRVGYDQILQAEGGVMSMTGEPGAAPTKVGVPIADLAAGLYGAIGALAALLGRERDGRGRRVSTSLLAGQIGIHVYQGTRYLVAGEVPGPSGRFHPTIAPYGTFAAADGPIVVGVGNDTIWRRFCVVLGMDADDPRFVSNEDRMRHRAELHGLVESRLATRPASSWVRSLGEAGVPAGEVKTLDALYATQAVREQDLVWDVDHSTAGEIALPGNPLRFDGAPLSGRRPPPTLGEHNDDVRHELGHREKGAAHGP